MASGRGQYISSVLKTLAPDHRRLLDFFVRMVLSAKGAELFELQPLRHGLLVLHAGVVLSLALGALQCDLFSWHQTLLPFLTQHRAQWSAAKAAASCALPIPESR
jgi:hypothetical protein